MFLESWGLSLVDSLLISHMQVPQRLCSQLPEVRTLAWLQGPWWEAPMGLYRPMAPATRGQQGSTGSQSGPELSGGLPEGGSISQVPQQPLRPMQALSTMGCTGCGAWLWVILFQKVVLLRIRNATSRPLRRKERDLKNLFSSLSVL